MFWIIVEEIPFDRCALSMINCAESLMIVYCNKGLRQYDSFPERIRRRRVWEFQAVLKGKIRPLLASGTEEASSRTLWVFGPDNLHGWRGSGRDEAAEIAVFHYDIVPRELEQYCRSDGWISIPLNNDEPLWLRENVNLAYEHFFNPLKITPIYFQHLLLELSLFVLGQNEHFLCPDERPQAARIVARAKSIYDSRMEYGIGMEQVAAESGVSVSHLRRLFQQQEGKSPAAVFAEMRVRRALELLVRTEIPVTEIALTCGFSSHSAFSRTFHRHTGLSPRQVRKEGARAALRGELN
jgi:AraC-like DNA-binding protein